MKVLRDFRSGGIVFAKSSDPETTFDNAKEIQPWNVNVIGVTLQDMIVMEVIA